MIYVRIGNVCVCVCRGCTSPARTHRRPCPHSQIPAIWSRNRPTETGEGCVLVFRFLDPLQETRSEAVQARRERIGDLALIHKYPPSGRGIDQRKPARAVYWCSGFSIHCKKPRLLPCSATGRPIPLYSLRKHLAPVDRRTLGVRPCGHRFYFTSITAKPYDGKVRVNSPFRKSEPWGAGSWAALRSAAI